MTKGEYHTYPLDAVEFLLSQALAIEAKRTSYQMNLRAINPQAAIPSRLTCLWQAILCELPMNSSRDSQGVLERLDIIVI